MKKAIKGLSLAMGIASMTATADVGAMHDDNTITETNSKMDTSVVVTMSPEEINEEMEKWECNVKNGLLGMLRDINLKVGGTYLDDEEVRQLFGVSSEYFMWKDHFLFKKRRIAQMVAQRVDHIYNAVKVCDGCGFDPVYLMKNGLFYISIDLIFRWGTSHESLFDLFLNYRNVHDSRRYTVDKIFHYSLLRELMRLNGDPKALSASFVFNAMKNGYSLDQLKELEGRDGLICSKSCGLDIATVRQSSSSSSSSSSTAIGGLNLSSSSDSIGHQSLLDKFKSIDLPYDDAIATSSSSKSTPEGSVCSSSNESSISSTKEQKRKFMVESIIALLREQDNSEDTLYVYLIKNNLSCLPLRVWLELDLITEVFLEGNDDFEAFRRMLLSTIDRLFLENCHDPRRVANILETTRDGRGRNLIDIIIQYAKIDRVSADFVLSETLVKKYEIPFSGETLKKIKVVAI
jgi:hypothetical protein